LKRRADFWNTQALAAAAAGHIVPRTEGIHLDAEVVAARG